MSEKRQIVAIELPDVTPGTPATGIPEITRIKPTELLVDETYQRGLSDKSLKLIARIVAGWDWRRFKPPVAAWTEDGLEVIDGQHTAIAAASHPDITEIPVVIVDAANQADRASAFIGQNRDRIAISSLQMHAAAAVAGDQDAQTIDVVCRRAGVRVLRNPAANNTYRPGETIAVGAISELIKKRSVAQARQVLEVLVQAKVAPIRADHIKAVELLLTDPQYAEGIETEELVRVIETMGTNADREGKVFAAAHGVAKWRGLAVTWFQNRRKRRRQDAPEFLQAAE